MKILQIAPIVVLVLNVVVLDVPGFDHLLHGTSKIEPRVHRVLPHLDPARPCVKRRRSPPPDDVSFDHLLVLVLVLVLLLLPWLVDDGVGAPGRGEEESLRREYGGEVGLGLGLGGVLRFEFGGGVGEERVHEVLCGGEWDR